MTIKELNTLCGEIKKTPNFTLPIEEWPVLFHHKRTMDGDFTSVAFFKRPRLGSIIVIYCIMLDGGTLMDETLVIAEYPIRNNQDWFDFVDEVTEKTGISRDLIATISML
jgi:hypothetical protein